MKNILTLLLIFFGAILNCKPEIEPLKVGGHVWIGYEPFFIYSQYIEPSKGMIHSVEYSSASRTIRGLKNDVLDVGLLTLDEAILLKQYIKDLKVIYFADFSNGSDALVSMNLSRVEQIKKKKIAVENTALGAFFLTRILEYHNIAPQEVEIVPMEIIKQEEALMEKKVDAIVTYDPVKSKIISKGGKVLFDSSQIPNEILDVVVTRENVIKNKIDFINYLLKGWQLALKKISVKDEGTIKFILNREGLVLRELDEVLSGVKLLDLEDNKKIFKDPKTNRILLSLTNTMKKQGFIHSNIDIEDLLEPNIVKKLDSNE